LKTHYHVYSDPLLDPYPLQNKSARVLTHILISGYGFLCNWVFMDFLDMLIWENIFHNKLHSYFGLSVWCWTGTSGRL